MEEPARNREDKKAEQLKVVRQDQDFISDRLSSQTRYIAFGVLGAYFALTITSSANGHLIYLEETSVLLTAATVAIFAIIADMAQYVAGYVASKRAEENEEGGFEYDKKWWSQRLRAFFFTWKQVLAIGSALCLVYALLAGALC